MTGGWRSRCRHASLAVVLVACSLPACRTPAPEGGNRRIAELERRVEQLEARLATATAGPEALRAASVEELVERLGADDLVTRYRAAQELARRDDSDRARLLEALTTGSARQREAAAAAAASSASAEDLAVLLVAHGFCKRDTERMLLATALGRTDSDEAVEPLMADLEHPARRVRAASVIALRRLGRPRAAVPLLGVALSDQPWISPLAAEAVQALGAPGLLFVGDQWVRWNPREREAVLAIVGRIDGLEVLGFLTEKLSDPSTHVALQAAHELARHGDRSGERYALAHLASDDPVASRRAREVLDALERAEAESLRR